MVVNGDNNIVRDERGRVQFKGRNNCGASNELAKLRVGHELLVNFLGKLYFPFNSLILFLEE